MLFYTHLVSGLTVARANGSSIEHEGRDVALLVPLGNFGYEGLFGHVELGQTSFSARSFFLSWRGQFTYAWRDNDTGPTLRGWVDPTTNGQTIKSWEADVEARHGDGYR